MYRLYRPTEVSTVDMEQRRVGTRGLYRFPNYTDRNGNFHSHIYVAPEHLAAFREEQERNPGIRHWMLFNESILRFEERARRPGMLTNSPAPARRRKLSDDMIANWLNQYDTVGRINLIHKSFVSMFMQCQTGRGEAEAFVFHSVNNERRPSDKMQEILMRIITSVIQIGLYSVKVDRPQIPQEGPLRRMEQNPPSPPAASWKANALCSVVEDLFVTLANKKTTPNYSQLVRNVISEFVPVLFILLMELDLSLLNEHNLINLTSLVKVRGQANNRNRRQQNRRNPPNQQEQEAGQELHASSSSSSGQSSITTSSPEAEVTTPETQEQEQSESGSA